jgi:hypothetical protein
MERLRYFQRAFRGPCTVVHHTASGDDLRIELLASINPPHGHVLTRPVVGLDIPADRKEFLQQKLFWTLTFSQLVDPPPVPDGPLQSCHKQVCRSASHLVACREIFLASGASCSSPDVHPRLYDRWTECPTHCFPMDTGSDVATRALSVCFPSSTSAPGTAALGPAAVTRLINHAALYQPFVQVDVSRAPAAESGTPRLERTYACMCWRNARAAGVSSASLRE